MGTYRKTQDSRLHFELLIMNYLLILNSLPFMFQLIVVDLNRRRPAGICHKFSRDCYFMAVSLESYQNEETSQVKSRAIFILINETHKDSDPSSKL